MIKLHMYIVMKWDINACLQKWIWSEVSNVSVSLVIRNDLTCAEKSGYRDWWRLKLRTLRGRWGRWGMQWKGRSTRKSDRGDEQLKRGDELGVFVGCDAPPSWDWRAWRRWGDRTPKWRRWSTMDGTVSRPTKKVDEMTSSSESRGRWGVEAQCSGR